MLLLVAFLMLHGLGVPAGAAEQQSPLSAQLGYLEKHSADGQKQRVLFSELITEMHYHVIACVGGFKPNTSGSNPKADARAFQDCLKRCFNENIQEPLMRKLYPDEQLSSCK